MKSITLALTWEFWRQSAVSLAITVVSLAAMVAWLFGEFRFEEVTLRESVLETSLHAFCFMVIVVGLAAVVCQSTASATQRFTLPVSVRTSVAIPMLNGVLAMVLGYLAIGLFANGMFNAQWTLIKPVLIAVCMITVSQAACSLTWQSRYLRGALVAGLASALGVAMIFRNGDYNVDHFHQNWQTISPTDVCLAILIPALAFTYSVAILALARHGTELSMAAIGRWFQSRLDINIRLKPRGSTPMSMELWSDWVTRGRAFPAGAIVIVTVVCGFLLSGRFDWESARDATIALTMMQLLCTPVYGLFIGHVGERFDFNEYAATRPLSDMQLAEVKLRTTLKVVGSTWLIWVIGLAVGVVCLAVVGQGPTSWNDFVPPNTPSFVPMLVVLLLPLVGWTLLSFGVSVSILRPWMLKAIFLAFAIVPAIPLAVLYNFPDSGQAIATGLQWSYVGLTIVGTLAVYRTASRLRLISKRRVATVGVAYALICAVSLSIASVLPPLTMPHALAMGLIFSSLMLPFVCFAAVPLAVWWNRHR